MKCNLCGRENIEEAKYCAGCGNELVEEVVAEAFEESQKPHVPKCFDVFAKLGFGLGLGGLIGCLFIGLGYIVAIPGIVFSALGKKSINYHAKAKTGLVLSILGTVLGIIIYFAFFFILGLIAGLSESGYYYY
jgi:hypothetical protein